MAEITPRLALPLLQAGQAQKEIYHNEALAMLDIALAAAVEAVGINVPPSSPAIGQCWLVGSHPTGDWDGAANAIAGWTSGGWRFVPARVGMVAWSIADQLFAGFNGIDWQVGVIVASRVVIDGVQIIGPQRESIAQPSGGSVVDVEARAALDAMLATLRGHGLIAS
ncbi:MAG: DUF2793 domain-containing protein [Sphingomonas sp.]|jgi:hypothetical protein